MFGNKPIMGELSAISRSTQTLPCAVIPIRRRLTDVAIGRASRGMTILIYFSNQAKNRSHSLVIVSMCEVLVYLSDRIIRSNTKLCIGIE